MQNSKKSLLLLSMPFAETSIPSIQLGLLEAYLKQQQIPVSTNHLYLRAADFYGLQNYNFLINNPNDSYTAQMVFSKYVFPNHWEENQEKFKYYFDNIMSCDQKHSLDFSFDEYTQKTDAFVDWIIKNVDYNKYDLIGFTLNYGQILPSLAIAKKIKKKNPDKKIIFGGSSTINELGKRIVSNFNYVDFIVSGEGEKALFSLTTDFESYQYIPGLIYQEENKVLWNENHEYINMNNLPYPDYQSYYDELHKVSTDIIQYHQLFGRLPIELSRGCWWNNCTFCNVSAYHKKYREKNYDRFIKELTFLSDTYQMLDFQVIGSTLPQNDYRSLCKKIIDLNRDFSLITEARAGVLTSSDYTLLKKAGFTHIQTGIEAFSTHYLKKMNKGTKVIDNIAALKYCKENRIKNSYNLIINYPNEDEIDFEQTKKNVEHIQTYLEPPNISKFVLGYQSPIFYKQDQFNIKSVEPKIIDTIMYPKELLDQNFCFFYSFKRKNKIKENPWKELVANWKKNYTDQQIRSVKRNNPLNHLVFYFKDGKNFLKIYDKRYSDKALIYTLNKTERDLFLACTDVISMGELKNQFSQLTPNEIEEILHSFIEAGIVYKEDNLYLSLPLNYHTYYDKNQIKEVEDIEQIRAYINNL